MSGSARCAGGGAVLVVTTCMLASIGCRSTASREFESEASALGVRIDALRNAPNEAKRPLLERLRSAACNAEPVCRLKALCVEAYATHVAAIDASSRAGALLQSPDGGTRASLQAAVELSRAEEGLERARVASERCAREQGRTLLEARAR